MVEPVYNLPDVIAESHFKCGSEFLIKGFVGIILQDALAYVVAAALVAGGRFVVEAFVPPEPDHTGAARRSGVVGVRSLSADRVVLSIDTTDPAAQRSEGQYVEFTEAGGVRLRPWSIRWSTPAQLDASVRREA